MNLGQRIKQLRHEKKVTLTGLSEKSGVQIATLSRIENGKMTGTLESHMDIAKALGLELTELYKGLTQEDSPVGEAVATPSILETFSYNSSASYEILATNVLSKKMMPIVLRVEPGGKTNPEQSPAGGEKFIFVLEGALEVHIGERSYPLTANKTLYFDASHKHWFVNPGKVTTRAISVVSPVIL
jgi:mannose-6-phosphate isomerase-like protein (cupin superfamily)